MTAHEFKLEGLRFEDLSFCHDENHAVLSSATFDFPVKGFVQLKSGASGMGKSSVLRLLAGLIQPKSGRYIINNQVVSELSFEEFLPLRLKIGFSFDMGGLINNRTLRDNMLLPLNYHKLISPEEAHERVDGLLKDFEIARVGDLRPSAVSGSQRKAACVARSFVMNPAILILDEPTVGLSPHNIQILKKRIRNGFEHEGLKMVIATTEDQRLLEGLLEHEVELNNAALHTKPQLKAVGQ